MSNTKIKIGLLSFVIFLNSCSIFIPTINKLPATLEITDITLKDNIAKVSVSKIDKSGLNNLSAINNAYIEGIHFQNLSSDNTNTNFSIDIPADITQDFKESSENLKNLLKYATLAVIYDKIVSSPNNINNCDYKENYLNLIQAKINQNELIIINQSNDISIESKNNIPDDNKIIDLENKIETRIVKLDALRDYLVITAKKLKCQKDNENL